MESELYYRSDGTDRLENKTEIAYVMPSSDAEYLMDVGYLSSCTHGMDKMTSRANCKFIVEHYFDMKQRAK